MGGGVTKHSRVVEKNEEEEEEFHKHI